MELLAENYDDIDYSRPKHNNAPFNKLSISYSEDNYNSHSEHNEDTIYQRPMKLEKVDKD